MVGDGDLMKVFRERQKWTQQEFAGFLNGRFNRKYDKAKISRWETGAERVPSDVLGFIALGDLEFKATGRCIVTAVANQKGGVGKTESCVNLGFVLAKSGELSREVAKTAARGARSPHDPSMRVGQTLQSIGRGVTALKKDLANLKTEHRERLRELRDEIEAVLRCAGEQSDKLWKSRMKSPGVAPGPPRGRGLRPP